MLVSVQNLRGVAALLVVLSHLFSSNIEPTDKIARTISSYAEFGTLGVEMFFIISGFIIPYSLHNSSYRLKDFSHFMTKRFLRVYLPYIASILLTIAIYLAWKWFSGDYPPPFEITTFQIALNTIFANPFFDVSFVNYSYWTLFVELQYYLFIAVLYPFFFRGNYWLTILLTSIFFSFNFIFPVGALPLYSNYLLFSIGTILYMYHTKKIPFVVFFSLLLLHLFGQLYWHQFALHWDRGIPIFIVSIISIFLIIKFTFTNRLLYLIGNISFSLYLTHQPILALLNQLFSRFHIPTNFVFKSVELVAILSISWIFYHFFEKPSVQLTKKIRTKHT